MYNLYGAGSWRIIFERRDNEIIILRAVTDDESAVLPDEIEGLPVAELAQHALAAGHRDTEGEQVDIIGSGKGLSAEADNSSLRELTLPAGLKSIGQYAFFNCRRLETLHMCDGVGSIGAAAFMNCRSMKTIFMTEPGSVQGPALSLMANEFSSELQVVIYGRDGRETHLVFPEYYESYEENSPAHHFELNITGGGYRYRSVFKDRILDPADYDRLWPVYTAAEYDNATALRLAWGRVRYPVGLSPEARDNYCSFLARNGENLVDIIYNDRDVEGLRIFLSMPGVPTEDIAYALNRARETGFTAATAILLRKNAGAVPAGRGRSFEL